jgi:hypothetical protein
LAFDPVAPLSEVRLVAAAGGNLASAPQKGRAASLPAHPGRSSSSSNNNNNNNGTQRSTHDKEPRPTGCDTDTVS